MRSQHPDLAVIDTVTSSDLLSLLLNNASELVFIINRDHTVKFFNKQASNYVNKLGIELHVGMPVWNFIPESLHITIRAIYERVLKGETITIEDTAKKADGLPIHFSTLFRPAINNDGAIEGIVTITKDITEKKLAETQLAESKRNLDLLLDNTDESFIMVDKDWKVVLFNKTALQSVKNYFNKDLTVGFYFLNLVQSHRKDIVKNLLIEVFAGREQHIELPIFENEKLVAYIINHYKPVLDANGTVLYTVIHSSDVTQKKLAEQTLKEAEERWRFALESGNQGVWDWNLKTNEVFFSQSFRTLYGFSENDLESTYEQWKTRVHPDDVKGIENAIEKHSESGNAYYESVYRFKAQHGNYKWILSRGMIIERDAGQMPVRMIGTHTDITETKTAEDTYKLLFFSHPNPMWIFDVDTLEIIEVNESAILHYGYSREEFLKMKLTHLRSADDQEDLQAIIQEVKGSQATRKDIVKHKKKNGQVIYVEVTGNYFSYQGKNTRLITVNDITERILFELELKKSNERFELASKASSEALWEWDVIKGEVYISKAYTDILGWFVKDDREFKEWYDYIHPEESDTVTERFYATIKNPQKDKWEDTYRYLKSDGSYAYVVDRAYIIRNEEGEAIKLVGAIRDITKEKQFEEQLRQSNQRFTYAAKATSDAIYDWDLSTNELQWSDGMQILFGHQPKNVTIKNWETYIHPDDRKQVVEGLSFMIENTKRKFWKEQYRFLNADGTYNYVLDKGFVLRDKDGKPLRMIGAMQDITELKLKEKELIKSNDRYHYASVATSDMIWDWDIRTNEIIISDNYQRIFGWELPENKKLSIETYFENAHPDDKDRIRKSLQKIIQDPAATNWQEDFRFKRAEGTYAWVSVKSYIIRNSKGEPIRMIGAVQDISERISSMEEIKKANERFDIVLKATHDLIWDWNLQSNTIYRDPDGLKNVYGISQNDSVENITDWLARIHPDDSERVKKLISEITQSKDQDTFEIEYRFKKDNGSYTYVYDRGKIIRNGQGKPIRMIGAAQDITERKRLEQILIQKELERQKAINQATVETQEQERSEIGKELHDNVNQVLTTTKLYLDLALSNPEMKDELVEKSVKNIINVINEIRQLSRSLMDPSIGDLGLIDSIHDLVNNINLTRKIHVRLKANEDVDAALSQNQKLTIFRIIQEALNNAIRHAKASTVDIHIQKTDNHVRMDIQDDGIGFNPNKIKKGAGLKNIQNRVYLIDGKHIIKSEPEKGCTITIEFPITDTITI